MMIVKEPGTGPAPRPRPPAGGVAPAAGGAAGAASVAIANRWPVLLSNAMVRAPFDGVVTQRLAEIGQVLSAGQGVVTVARPEIREAVVDIPEQYVGALPADGVFTVSLQSAPELTARGRVREIAPLAEAGTRSRRIRITLDDPGPGLRDDAHCLAQHGHDEQGQQGEHDQGWGHDVASRLCDRRWTGRSPGV